MCTVSIHIDETVLRDMRPELKTPAAIRLWVQHLVDAHLQQMSAGQLRNTTQSEVSQKELWHAIEQDPELTLTPSVIDVDDVETVDLATFRADLHRMVDEIYAEA